MTSQNLEGLVRDAQNGDREALESVVKGIQPNVFRLAFRMLGFPEDAEDSTQEILIKVITHLGEFKGDSAFTTWVFRVACNHLLTTRKRKAEQMGINIDLWENLIHVETRESGSAGLPEAEKALLIEEVRIGCMQGLLQTLDRDHRLAVVLGEIFDVTGKEGAYILDIAPETFRKRLSRGRRRIHGFMRKNCGLVKDRTPCRCVEQADRDLATGWSDPRNLSFARYFDNPEEQSRVLRGLSEIEEMSRINYLYQNYPVYSPPDSFSQVVKDMIDSGGFPLLSG